MCVFETWTATGSELFSLLTCHHTTTFTLLSIYSPLEMIVSKSGRQYDPSPPNVLFRLPSASQFSKTRVLKLPSKTERLTTSLLETDLLGAKEIWERSYIQVVCGNKVLTTRCTYQKRRVVNLYTLDDKKWTVGLEVRSPRPVCHSVKPIPYTAIAAFKRGRQAVRRERKLERKVVISRLKLHVTSALKRTLRKTITN